MIIVLKPGCSDAQIQHVIDRIEELGFTPHVSRGAARTIIGVNNRNLATFETDLATSERLIPRIAPYCLAVSESALATSDDLRRVAQAGARAVLIGTTFCGARDVEAKVREVMGW